MFMTHQQHHKRPLTFRKANNSAPLGRNRPVFEVDFAHFSSLSAKTISKSDKIPIFDPNFKIENREKIG